MQALAKWLLARPHHAVLGLAVSLFLPAPQMTSGALLVLLVLVQGARLAAFETVIAAALLAVLNLTTGGSATAVLVLAAGSWVPAMLLAGLLVATKSLTLTLQVSVIVTVIAMLIFQFAIPDLDGFWQPYLEGMAATFRQVDLRFDAELLNADVMTVSAVLVLWMLFTVALLSGYWFYRRLPIETRNYGLFREVSFGRVIAFTLALASVLILVVEAAWIKNIAQVLFGMFTMQGLAIVHWLRSRNVVPVAAVVAIYVLSPFLQIFLSIVGYMDAWFSFRRRFLKA